ncbi:MAG: peptidase S8, partial [Bacteroidetes bacterium HGW-Bacteroidetes-2]
MLLAVFYSFTIFAQTPEQSRKITSNYNTNYLKLLSADFLEKSQSEKASAVAYAKAYNLPITKTLEDGGFAEVQRVLPDGTLIYYRTNNVNAAKSTRVNHLNIGGSTGLNLDGQNMIAYVWDGGHARITHQEFDGPGGNNRVSVEDAVSEGGIDLNFHAAHVSGTIAASGVFAPAKGMAPQAKVRGYKWNNDVSEATTAAANGMLLSNHSYGFDASAIPDQWFGAYQSTARGWDVVQYNAPFYLMVNSAGNDGEDATSNGLPLLGNANYDKLNGISTAKNNLVVAAANDANIDVNGNLLSVSIASFSSQGPTDDFRIKPDITGNGVGLTSSFETSNTAYGTISGTSMSSPNVTGSLLLLQQHANNVNGNFMRAATLKGLVLHTADDGGPNGPDALWGWGLLNAKRAAEVITNNGTATLLNELTLLPGQTFTINVESDGINNLLASISWTDPAGAINNVLNSSVPALVNDLDIRVIQGGNTYYPWRLTGLTTNSNGGDNTVDPFERVDVSGASGSYTITVTHKGTLTGGSQNFSLVVSGLLVTCTSATIPQNITVNSVTGTTAGASWQAVAGTLYDIQYRKIGTPNWVLVENLSSNDYLMTGLSPTTNYEMQVRSKCLEGVPSAFSASVNFTTIGLTYCDSSSQFPTADLYISNVTLNTINNSSSFNGYSNFTNISTTLEQGQNYTISITAGASNPGFFANYSVWIDYNGNESFNDAGEQVFTLETTAGVTATGSFTVPVGINPVTTRMRVSMNNAGIPTSCETFNFGEVEDYSIVIQPEGYFYQDGIWLPSDPSGIATALDNISVMNGTTSLNADTEAKNLLIQQGASLSIPHSLKVNGNITNEGLLIFVSNATTTGQLDTFTGTITGNVVIQRYLPARRAFRFLSSAVTTTGSINANWQ